jgi:Transposase DDE domain
VRGEGSDVIVPTKDRQRTKPRRYAPPQGREAERIERFLSKPEGKALYRRRQQLVEPVFADIKFNRRADRFLRRGLGACHSEWRLIAATHNLLKLWRAGLTAGREGMPAAIAA